jgi:hypothetical protein
MLMRARRASAIVILSTRATRIRHHTNDLQRTECRVRHVPYTCKGMTLGVTCRMLHSLHQELEPVESGMEFSATNTPQKASGADAETQEVTHASMSVYSIRCTAR